MLFAGEGLLPHLFLVLLHGLKYRPVQIGVFFDEFGSEAIEETKHVMNNQQLPIAGKPGPDGNNRNSGFFRDDAGNFRRNWMTL